MGFELDAGRPQVLGVRPAHLVVGHRPDETGGASENGDPGRRVGHRSARDEAGGAHGCLHGVGRGQVDEGHRTLFQTDRGQLFGGRQFDDVEQWRTDGHDVEIMAVGFVGGRSLGERARSENLPAAPRVACTDAFSSHVSRRARLGIVPLAPDDRAGDLPHRDRAGRRHRPPSRALFGSTPSSTRRPTRSCSMRPSSPSATSRCSPPTASRSCAA